MARCKEGLARFCQSTHDMIEKRLGPPSIESLSIETLFPRNNPMALIDDLFYVEIYEKNPSLKLQRKLSVCALKIANKNFIDGLTEESKEISASDIIRTHSRSFSPILFRVSLADRINRMTARAFIAWMCFYLAIPQPPRLGNASYIDSLGYEAERCLQPHLLWQFTITSCFINTT